jgi:hypothetical protein
MIHNCARDTVTRGIFLPNAEQDGYSYGEMIARWGANLSADHFRLADLFGF